MNLQVGVKAIIKNEQGKYLFIKRSQLLGSEKETQWDIPGGRIEATEHLVEALRREIKEETGMVLAEEPTLLAAQDIFVSAKDLHVVRLTYSANATGKLSLSDEHVDHIWSTLKEAESLNLDEYLRPVLSKINYDIA